MKTRSAAERQVKKAGRIYVVTGEHPSVEEKPKPRWKRKHQPARTQGQKDARKEATRPALKASGKRGDRLSPEDRKSAKECKRLAFSMCALHGPECWGRMEAHHVLRRGHGATRHDQRNLVCLCHYHHQVWLPDHKDEFNEWFNTVLRPGMLRVLEILANHNGREAVE